jgi:hypothetical protein
MVDMTLVQNQFDYYRRGIDQNVGEIIDEFRRTFEEDSEEYKSFKTISADISNSTYADIDSQIMIHDWQEVYAELNNAVSKIVVREVNGGSGDILNYFDHIDGLSVIAIGGDKLSRGLTLEGLSVSYFLRASKMYDTLMQMGRWFGYRPGYVDLCRLYTSRELNEWFCHITHASEELREEFDYMSDVADSTPEKYALKVRTHPGVLQITSSNKMKSTVNLQVSWAGRLVESYELKKDATTIRNNFNVTESFIKRLNTPTTRKSNSILWFDVTAEIIKDFFRGFQIFDNLKAYEPASLVRYIDLLLSKGELDSWRVSLMSKQAASFSSKILVGNNNENIGFYTRTFDDKNSNDETYYIRKSHIISPRDEFIDLTQDDYNMALKLTEERSKKKNLAESVNYPNGEIVRNEIRSPKNPLLLIYFLDPAGAYPEGTEIPDRNIPIVGYAISFPGSRFKECVSYRINEGLVDLFNYDDDINDNYDDED